MSGIFDDEDFSLFDDKQTEQLNAVEKKDDGQADDQVADDQAANDAAASGDDKADDEGKSDDDKSDDKSAEEDSSEADKADDDTSDDKADEDKDAPADKSSSDQDADKKDDDAAADDKSDDDKKEQFATKDDIRTALAEQAAFAETQQTARKTLRNELRTELFPEGIDVDLKIKDSDNGIITGPSQIAGKLVNPSTQELFTYEEAKDYWDNAQKHIDKAIEEREQLIDLYAENNQSFFEGSQIVEKKYGSFLKKNPEIAKDLLDNYLKTAKVTKSGYITDMPLNVVAYYESVMKPHNAIASQMELQAQGEADRKTAEDEKKGQEDRADLPVNGNTPPPKKKDELTSAFDRYFDGK